MTEKRFYELVPYDCQDGSCLMLHEKTRDSKLGTISLSHRNIGETIVSELNELSEMLYAEQLRTIPLVLDTHISDDDFCKVERMITKHFNSYSKMHSINKIQALQRENEMLQQRNPFNKVMLTRAINKKIDDVITSTEYGDVSRGCRIFAQNALIELKQELGI